MKNTFLIILWCCSLQAVAQEFVGLSNGSYSGIHAAYQNPATLAGSRLSFQLNISAVDMHAINNYLQYDPPYSMFKLAKEGVGVENSHFVEKLDDRPKFFSAGLEFRGLGLLISTRKLGFAVSTRSRLWVQGNSVSEETARLLWLGADSAEVQGVSLKEQKVFLNNNIVNEAAFSFSTVLLEAGPHVVKGGLTVKRLWGLYSSTMDIDNFSYTVKEDASSEPYLDIERIDVDFGYTSTSQYQEDIAWKDILLMKNAAGKGWGWDLGMIYEYSPGNATVEDDSRKKKVRPYRLRLGLALTDLGSIRYSGEQAMKHYQFSRENLLVSSENLLESDAATLDEVLVETFNIQPSERLDTYKVYLPASLGVNLDARLLGPLYLNLAWAGNLHEQRSAGLQQNDLLSFTPRLEGRVLELAVPFMYYSAVRQFAIGSYFRLGPFFIGSDNLGGLLQLGDIYGADLYLGFSIYGVKRKK